MQSLKHVLRDLHEPVLKRGGKLVAMAAPLGNKNAVGNKGGGVDLYKPEYCDLILKIAGEGGGITEYAAEIGVGRKTIYAWAEKYVEFGNAIAHARTREAVWWIQLGRENLIQRPGSTFNQNVWAWNMHNRFGWRLK